jgi:hypothetical protein
MYPTLRRLAGAVAVAVTVLVTGAGAWDVPAKYPASPPTTAAAATEPAATPDETARNLRLDIRAFSFNQQYNACRVFMVITD